MSPYLKILALLAAINAAPPLLGALFGKKWNMALDGGRRLGDENRLFGPHKTYRGFMGAVLVGTLGAALLGMPWWLGTLSGILSMTGDLVASFIKRRFDQPSGASVVALDQVLEGLFPFAVLAPYFSLTGWHILLVTLSFSLCAYLGSWIFMKLRRAKSTDTIGEAVLSRSRPKGEGDCETVKNPLHRLYHIEFSIYRYLMLKTGFRWLGLYERGASNALKVELRSLNLSFEDLPPAFDDYKILFLSDLHLDGLEGLKDKIQDIIEELTVDLCILGGDYRVSLYGSASVALERLGALVQKICARDGIYAVLGNHDCLEMVRLLEKLGVKFLINDATAIERNGERVWLVGVDDPHYYRCHDLKGAFEGVPLDEFTVFLAHSPELYRQAASFAPQLYLCGHTHAGQIQLPIIGPVFTHSRAPRRLSHGIWRYQGMLGYTSAGVGVSILPARFGCRGEAVLITMKSLSR